MMIDAAIIDYKLGNLHSVYSACKYIGINAKITHNKEEILSAKSVILPGVGAFGEAMNNLRLLDLVEVIKKTIDMGKPFFGICLGLQLLFDESEEFGSNGGLGIINGKVKKFQPIKKEGINYPVPQVGWNRIYSDKSWNNSLLQNNYNNDYMYFVHSFYVDPSNKNLIESKSIYGDQEYCSAISFNNIFASQFHPEKSGETGLNLYKQFKLLL